MASATIVDVRTSHSNHDSSLSIPANLINAAASSPTTEIDNAQVSYWTGVIRAELGVNSHGVCNKDSIEHQIDPKIMDAPRRRSSQDLAAAIAIELFPTLAPSMAVQQYENEIKTLRSSYTRQRWASANTETQQETWRSRIQRQGPWDELNDPVSLNGAPALPMPVDQASKDSLSPFFGHLRAGGTSEMPVSSHHKATLDAEPGSNMPMIEYPKGVLYADGRVDLCKMVVGPRSIQDLMDSLKGNTFVKHFLLGNNIIGAVGAKAIASFVDEHPDRFETWYLAGNCINTASFRILADSMLKSSVITNVWLKRNPLGQAAAVDISRLLLGSRIETLDLDQTELGDVGVAELFSALSKAPTPLALKHIYLNACGVSSTACKQIASFLASPTCALESLYLSCNPIGTAVAWLASGFKQNHSLQRLTLQSCGLTSATTMILLDAIAQHPALIKLDLGQAYATDDLDQRYNWLTDECADLLQSVVESTSLQCLLLDDVAMSRSALNSILPSVAASRSMVLFSARSLSDGYREKQSHLTRKEHTRLCGLVQETLTANVLQKYHCKYNDFLTHHKRSIISPPGIELIDSVYRNRDAGLARRGIKKLDKRWQDADDTVSRSEIGNL